MATPTTPTVARTGRYDCHSLEHPVLTRTQVPESHGMGVALCEACLTRRAVRRGTGTRGD